MEACTTSDHDQVMYNKDLIAIISTFADNASQYKAIIATCRLWYNVVKSPERAHQYMNVISTLIMRHQDLSWSNQLMSYVTMEVMGLFLNSIGMYWYEISTNPRLTRDFIVKHIKKLNPHQLVTNRAMSCADIEWLLEKQLKNAKELLHYASSNPNLTSEFIEKYHGFLSIRALFQNQCLSLEYIQQCMQRSIDDGNNLDLDILISQPNLTAEFIRENRSKFHDLINGHPAVTIEMLEERDVSTYWCSNPNISGEFIENHINAVNWYNLSQNRALTMPLIEKYINKIDWTCVWKNPNATIEFMEANLARFKGILYL